jgi:23S rRNA pseudouridine1911/1915/1917 synthase
MALNILFEDNHLIIVNKPCGALAQGDKSGDAPLAEEVKAYIKEKYQKPGDVFLGIVHRLDRPVSGILIFARTSKALERMNALFRDKQVQKTYWAVVYKTPAPEAATLEHYIAKDAVKLKASVSSKAFGDAKACSLNYKVIGRSERYTLLEVEPHTGRYHQIRAQLSHIGSPIKGDIKYGSPRTNENGGIHLHARKVRFQHPVRQEIIEITAPLPEDDAVWGLFEQ